MDEDAVSDKVLAWLEDARRPFPGVTDLTAQISKEARARRYLGWTRDAILRLGTLCGELDRLMKSQAKLIEDMSATLVQWRRATVDSSQVATLALERLHQQQALVDAAVEWAKAYSIGDQAEVVACSKRVGAQAQALAKIFEKRS